MYIADGLPVSDVATPTLRVLCFCALINLRTMRQDVRVMAVDSQPAEPFPANKGQLVMAPGSRTDVFIDATQPSGSSSGIFIYDGSTPIRIAQLIVLSESHGQTHDSGIT